MLRLKHESFLDASFWFRIMTPLEEILDRIDLVWNTVTHLKSVKDSPEVRKAIETVQVRLPVVYLLCWGGMAGLLSVKVGLLLC